MKILQWLRSSLLLVVPLGLVGGVLVSHRGDRALAFLRGDLVYCDASQVDVGDHKHMDEVTVHVRLFNLTDDQLLIDGMNAFGSVTLVNAVLPLTIPPKGEKSLAFAVTVRTVGQDPLYRREIEMFVGSKQFGRQEVVVGLVGRVIDAAQIPPGGCSGS